MSYFLNPANGFNADLKRHRETEQRLRDDVAVAESEGNLQAALAYGNLLALLLRSKAELLDEMWRQDDTN